VSYCAACNVSMLISGIAVRPGLIAVTPAMHGSMMSAAAAVQVNGTGECVSLLASHHLAILYRFS